MLRKFDKGLILKFPPTVLGQLYCEYENEMLDKLAKREGLRLIESEENNIKEAV